MGPERPPGAQRLSVSIVFHQDNATWLILRGSGSTLFLVHTILKSSPGFRNTAKLEGLVENSDLTETLLCFSLPLVLERYHKELCPLLRGNVGVNYVAKSFWGV